MTLSSLKGYGGHKTSNFANSYSSWSLADLQLYKKKYFQVQFLTHSHSGKGEYSQKTALRNCPERNNPKRNNPESRKNPKH